MEGFRYKSRSENREFSKPEMVVKACSILYRAGLYQLVGLRLFAVPQNGETGSALFRTSSLILTGYFFFKALIHSFSRCSW